MKHIVCGHVFAATPSNLLSGHRCPNCYKTVPYTTATFKNKVFELVGDKYTVLDEYINSSTKLRMRHNVCGHEYHVAPSLFIHGNRCPECSVKLRRSLPEEIVAYHISQHFKIIQGYRPDWLKLPSTHNAEIDIWIPALKIGIEYDGGIHGQKTNYQKDIIKNALIVNSGRCEKLYRIREVEAHHMEVESDRIKLIKMRKSLSLTSVNGRKELGRVIHVLLEYLGISNSIDEISIEIVRLCQNRLDEYRQQIGLP